MLRYKVTPPPLPRCVERPRLLEQVLPAPVVVLAAPAGHGKTCLAAQVAAATGGPVAWFVADELDRDRATVVVQLFAALGAAWHALGPALPSALDDEAAVPLLGAALETLAGPGCLVLDDVHLLPAKVFEPIVRTAVAALPPDCRLVVCTRGRVPDSLLRAVAMGRARMLGPADLAFDVEECGRMCGSADAGAGVHARTGGWPLAVALGTHAIAPASGPSGSAAPSAGHLADLALAELGSADRNLLVVLARLPRVPTRLLKRLGNRGATLESFGRRHPVLLQVSDGWWAPREWLRDALREVPADQRLVARVAGALDEVDEEELAAQLVLSEARFQEAAPRVERLGADGMRLGRAAWVRALIADVPASARTFSLDLLAASAAQALSITDPTANDAASETVLLDLVDRSVSESPGALLRARALLASHYRMEGDLRLFNTCEDALGDTLRLDAPEEELAGRWSAEDAPAAAELLRIYGYALLVADSGESVERGRRMIAAALGLLDTAGHPMTSLRGWSAYEEVLLFLTPAEAALRPVRLLAHRLAELDHSDGAVRLAELATVEFFAGRYPEARGTTEMARDCAARTGNRIALAPLAAIEVAMDVLESGPSPEHADRFDDIAAELEAHPRLAPFTSLITAEFGIVLVRQGRADLARRCLQRAEQALGATFLAHTATFRCRRLRGLILHEEGSADECRAVLEDLRRDAVAEGRIALVELIDSDLSGRPRRPRGDLPRSGRSPVTVHVMAPELAVTMDGEPLPTPRGFPAKLLALLVASNGSMTVEAAIESLWPGADPTVGRNRLHGVILRLRRGLGFSADGPITCVEGVVRVDRSPVVQIDSWEFERLAARADDRPEARAQAVAAYRGEVLSVQFAYDDTVSAYRGSLRRTFLRLATAVLVDPSHNLEAEALAALARRTWHAAPDDDGVCVAVARTLASLGDKAEARDLIDRTARALIEVGLDGDAFRSQARREIEPRHRAVP